MIYQACKRADGQLSPRRIIWAIVSNEPFSRNSSRLDVTLSNWSDIIVWGAAYGEILLIRLLQRTKHSWTYLHFLPFVVRDDSVFSLAWACHCANSVGEVDARIVVGQLSGGWFLLKRAKTGDGCDDSWIMERLGSIQSVSPFCLSKKRWHSPSSY